MNGSTYTLSELTDLAQVTSRTVRYYIRQGLLPSPGRTGPGTRYSEDHLNRLRLIRQLQRRHLPLAEIRKQLALLSETEIANLITHPTASAGETAVDYIRSVLAGPANLAVPALGATPQWHQPAGSQVIGELRMVAPEPDGSESTQDGRAGGYGRVAGDGRVAQGRQASPAEAPFALRASVAPAAEPRPDARSLGHAEPDGTARLGDLHLPNDLAAQTALEQASPAVRPPLQRSEWEHLVLSPDIELHIRRPLSRPMNRLVARLVTLAGRLVQEEERT